MKQIVLLKKSIRGNRGTAMWKCPSCGTIAANFVPVGDGTAKCGECGAPFSFKEWEYFVAYEIDRAVRGEG